MSNCVDTFQKKAAFEESQCMGFSCGCSGLSILHAMVCGFLGIHFAEWQKCLKNAEW